MKINEILHEAYKISGIAEIRSYIGYVIQNIKSGSFKPNSEGQINQYHLYFLKDNTSWYYVLLNHKLSKSNIISLDHEDVVGFIELVYSKGVGFEVSLSYLVPELQGKGIGRKLYNHIITRDGVTLVSGAAQTTASQNLWMYFIDHPEKYRVFLQDIKHPADKKHIEFDFNQKSLKPEQEEELYGTHSESTTDWRMVCMKK